VHEDEIIIATSDGLSGPDEKSTTKIAETFPNLLGLVP